MDITLTGFVLFLHIGVAIGAFMVAGVLHASMQIMPRVQTIQELRPWVRLVHRLEPLFPFFGLALLALGAWLVHLEGDEGVGWSSGWVITAVASLVVIEALGGAVLSPRGKKLVALTEAAPDGPIPDDVRAAAKDPVFWMLANLSTGAFLGVVFVMAAKPSGLGAAIIVIVGALLGVGAAQAQLRGLPVDAADLPAQRAAADAAARSQTV